MAPDGQTMLILRQTNANNVFRVIRNTQIGGVEDLKMALVAARVGATPRPARISRKAISVGATDGNPRLASSDDVTDARRLARRSRHICPLRHEQLGTSIAVKSALEAKMRQEMEGILTFGSKPLN